CSNESPLSLLGFHPQAFFQSIPLPRRLELKHTIWLGSLGWEVTTLSLTHSLMIRNELINHVPLFQRSVPAHHPLIQCAHFSLLHTPWRTAVAYPTRDQRTIFPVFAKDDNANRARCMC